ncbi:GAF and ANTAR domain-containing protein [Naasia lichenicola]|uniref:GAF and ANTAR domain-containing protein n=1 Tax=Naasia lichenicola TaxID=2565933 RepID=A0A4S4FT57_9MICO|nr:GAF and ANTAR domain-containing protein [Naasia lichenicola]
MAAIADDSVGLAAPLLDAIPVTGASVSTIGSLLGTRTLDASDRRAARIDELQFDLGEGPCWDAIQSARPILEPDLLGRPVRHWPAFLGAMQREPVAALFAFPLMVGPLRFGAIDLYRDAAGELAREDAARAEQLAAVVSRHVLRRAIRTAGIAEPAEGDRFSRRIVHQATGFVIAQLGVSAEDAELLIQGQAFSENRPMTEVATDIVERRTVFSMDSGFIEDRSTDAPPAGSRGESARAQSPSAEPAESEVPRADPSADGSTGNDRLGDDGSDVAEDPA